MGGPLPPLPPQGYPPQGFAPPAPPPAAFLQNAFANLQQAFAARPVTDEIMSSLWVVLIVLAPLTVLFMFFFAFAFAFILAPLFALGFFGFIIMLVMIPAIIYIFFFFKLLTRMSAHFRREAQLRRAMIDYLRARASLDGREPLIGGELATMEAVHADSTIKDQPQSGALAILMIIPVVRWIVLYYVHKWPPDHDQRWLAFAQTGSSAFAKLGMPVGATVWTPMPRRSFPLYLVGSIFVPFFSIYWYYTFLKDGNGHFNTHTSVESAFAASIR